MRTDTFAMHGGRSGIRQVARAVLLALALVLTLGLTAPAQADSQDVGPRIDVSGTVTTMGVTQGESCFAGGEGLIFQSSFTGTAQPLGALDPSMSTVSFCGVYKQLGEVPGSAKVILIRDGEATLTASDGSGSLTLDVTGKLTFSDKPEDLSMDTTVFAREIWVVTGGTGDYEGAVGSIRASGEVGVMEFLLGALTKDLSGGIVVP